jgi:hypothetical protein
MADEKTIEVLVGKKEGTATNEAKGEKAPPKDEVGGRWHGAYVQCPYCWAVNYVNQSDRYNYWYRCWNCGSRFWC